MFLYDMLLALALAVFILATLLPSRRYQVQSRVPIWLLLLPLVFAAIWASGAWLAPVDMPVGRSYWITFLAPAVFLAILLCALSTPSNRAKEGDEDRVVPRNAAEEAAAGTAIAFTIFFWLILIAAAVAILLRYSRGAF